MKIGRIYFALSSLLIILVVIMVMASNAIPTQAYANAPAKKPDDTSAANTVVEIEGSESFTEKPLAEKMIAIGKSLIGTRYYYTGKTKATGFDCSGFTHYIFKQVGIELSPASKEQIYAGEQVDLKEVRKGDLLVFTGTNLSVRKPGHVGIVISAKGETPVRFIHSSSVGGVKISEVQGTRYAQRLLQVRRLLD